MSHLEPEYIIDETATIKETTLKQTSSHSVAIQ